MIENIGIIAAFGAMLCWGFGDFYIQKTARKIGSVEALFFICFIGSVALLPFVAKELPSLVTSTNMLFLLLLLGAITFVVAVVNFEAYRRGKLSVIDPILEFELPITMILAFVLLNESISASQIALSAIIFAGIFLVAVTKEKAERFRILEKGALLAVFCALGMGVINFFTGSLAREASPLLVIWVSFTVTGVPCLVYGLYKSGLREMVSDALDSRKIILAEGVFDTAAWLLFAIAMTHMPISLATAITESYPAIAVALGVLINKEILKKHQFIGMSMALLASIMLCMTV